MTAEDDLRPAKTVKVDDDKPIPWGIKGIWTRSRQNRGTL